MLFIPGYIFLKCTRSRIPRSGHPNSFFFSPFRETCFRNAPDALIRNSLCNLSEMANNQQQPGSEYLHTFHSGKRKQTGSEFEILELMEDGSKAKVEKASMIASFAGLHCMFFERMEAPLW